MQASGHDPCPFMHQASVFGHVVMCDSAPMHDILLGTWKMHPLRAIILITLAVLLHPSGLAPGFETFASHLWRVRIHHAHAHYEYTRVKVFKKGFPWGSTVQLY